MLHFSLTCITVLNQSSPAFGVKRYLSLRQSQIVLQVSLTLLKLLLPILNEQALDCCASLEAKIATFKQDVLQRI